MTDKRWITMAEAAERLGMALGTLKARRARGTFGARTRWRQGKLEVDAATLGEVEPVGARVGKRGGDKRKRKTGG